jgi:dienelactone hydrolase
LTSTSSLMPPHQLDPAGIAPQVIEYSHEGVTLRGYLFASPGNATPGVLVAHEAPGLNDHVKARAQALAAIGYTAFALDLYGDEGFPLAEALQRHESLISSPGLIRARAEAALNVLEAIPTVDVSRLAAIGFCQGGITALELARAGARIRGVVGFHPGLSQPRGSADGSIDARVLMMVGDQDPVVPPEHRQAFAEEMTSKRADWQLHIYGGVGHTFTNPAVDALGQIGFRYDARADRRSWQMALSFLEETFSGPDAT